MPTVIGAETDTGWTCTCPDYYREKTPEQVTDRIINAASVTVRPSVWEMDTRLFRAWTYHPDNWYTVSEGGNGICKHCIAVVAYLTGDWLVESLQVLKERSESCQKNAKVRKREIRRLEKEIHSLQK